MSAINAESWFQRSQTLIPPKKANTDTRAGIDASISRAWNYQRCCNPHVSDFAHRPPPLVFEILENRKGDPPLNFKISKSGERMCVD